MIRTTLVLILTTLGIVSITRLRSERPATTASQTSVVYPAPGVVASSLAADASDDDDGALEDAIVEEHNLARQEPKVYAAHLEALRRQFDGRLLRFSGEPSILTQEGVAAVDEAIDYLKKADPLPALISSDGMSKAAADHVRDQGPKGATGHEGSDGSKPWDRVGRYGTWDVVVGENLSYGPDRARRVVMGLIIDDGVPDRGHRTNIFSDEFRFIGVACGSHRTFRTMCTIDYAADFREDPDSPSFEVADSVLGESERDELGGVLRSTYGENDILPALLEVGHGNAGLAGGKIDRAHDLPRGLVVRP